jgi:hypothetical protein
LRYVTDSYPELFIKDNLGNKVWNIQHPMMQYINQIMQDPRFANDPEGLSAAADMAYGRYSRMSNANTQKPTQDYKTATEESPKGNFS